MTDRATTPDVLIIGSGQAGVPLAARLANEGKRVVLVERSAVGGTCVNYGCTPTKTMIASARAAHVARTGARLGVHSDNVTVDVAAVFARKDAIVKRWRDGVQKRIDGAGENLRLVKGHARFVADKTVEVDGERISAPNVVINVGARPLQPKITGIESVPWLDNHRALDLHMLPRHLVVVGGGYIGCELGQMFRRLGAEVTMVDPNRHLLPREDEDVSRALEDAFRAEGITLLLASKVEAIAPRTGDGNEVVVTLADGRRVEGSHLLVATGRVPNTDDLGCDRAGIELDGKGFIKVGEDYRTTANDVYALGDVTGGPQFTHTSWDDHRWMFNRLMGRGEHQRSDRLVPYTVFTDPQVAGVGISEREAKERGIAHRVATMPFGDVARAIEVDETCGIFKVILDEKEEQILGARIVGSEASELIHVYLAMMLAKADARLLVDGEMVHPAYAEGLQSVLMKLDRFSFAKKG